MTTLGEMYESQVGRLKLLLFVIEEMQESVEELSQNRPVLKELLCMLTKAGVLKQERIEKVSQVIEDKLDLLKRPYFLPDPDDPDNWEKVVVFPVELFLKQAREATKQQ